MNVKYRKKFNKGFTLAEIVIVIAVIGILSAVSVMSYAGITEKVNLNADKELIDEVNLILSSDETLYGKPNSVEAAMLVIENGGYKDPWTAKSKNAKIYWYSVENVLVLVKTEDDTEKLVYPENITQETFDASKNSFKYYDQDRVEARNVDILVKYDSIYDWPTEVDDFCSKMGLDEAKFKAALSISSDPVDYPTIKTSKVQTIDGTVIENLSSAENAYSYIYGGYMGSADSELDKGLSFIVLGQYIGTKAPSEVKQKAYSEAGRLLYAVFCKMQSGQIAKDVDIVFTPAKDENGNLSTYIADCSLIEWQTVSNRGGYFGCYDKDHPAVLKNINITSATKSKDVIHDSDDRYEYYFSGVFSSITKSAKICNLEFDSLRIDCPASDVDIPRTLNKSSRNTAALIGLVKIQKDDLVEIENVSIDKNSVINSTGCAAGLIGYICRSDNGIEYPPEYLKMVGTKKVFQAGLTKTLVYLNKEKKEVTIDDVTNEYNKGTTIEDKDKKELVFEDGANGVVNVKIKYKDGTTPSEEYDTLTPIQRDMTYECNCNLKDVKIEARISSIDYLSKDPLCGFTAGVISYMDNCGKLLLTAEGVTFAGVTSGYKLTAGFIAYMGSGKCHLVNKYQETQISGPEKIYFVSTNIFKDCKLDSKHSASKKAVIGIVKDNNLIESIKGDHESDPAQILIDKDPNLKVDGVNDNTNSFIILKYQ